MFSVPVRIPDNRLGDNPSGIPGIRHCQDQVIR